MVNPPPAEPNEGPLEAKPAPSGERERDLLRELREVSGRDRSPGAVSEDPPPKKRPKT